MFQKIPLKKRFLKNLIFGRFRAASFSLSFFSKYFCWEHTWCRISKKIFRKLLFSEDIAVIVGRNNAFHQPNENLTLKKYAELQHIYITSKGEGEKIVDRVLRKNSLKREIYLTVQSFLIVPYIVENSDLIATVSERVATQCSQQSKLCIYPFPSKIQKNKFHILWGKSTNSDQESQWLINSIVDLLAMTDKPHA